MIGLREKIESIPDSAYSLTKKDADAIIEGYKNSMREQQLETKKMRDEREARSYERYTTRPSRVRIHFPDEFILQVHVQGCQC